VDSGYVLCVGYGNSPFLVGGSMGFITFSQTSLNQKIIILSE
jgi:hypothetical protein